MRTRTLSILSVLCVCVLAKPSAADDSVSDDSAHWVTVVRPAQHQGEEPRFVIQTTSGIDFEVLDVVANTLRDAGDHGITLLPAEKIDLTFPTDAFLVMKLDGDSLVLAPGSSFPFSKTRSLAKQLRELGYVDSTVESPGHLLKRIGSSDPFARPYAFRAAGSRGVRTSGSR